MQTKLSGKGYIRVKRLAPELAVSVPTVWRWLKEDPTFPKPVKLSARVTAWDISEVSAWLDSRKGV
jgi:predicted DNA-binding transcriptional regulator AlpA